MYLILFCAFIALAAFLTADYLLKSVAGLEVEGKVYNAVENKKSKGFIVPALLRRADSLGKILSKIKNKKIEEFAGKIDADLKCLGGDYEKLNAYQIFALQIFAAVAGLFFCMLFISTDIMFLFLIALLFFFLPLLKIRESVKKRKELIFKQLPDMADLLSVMLDAGSDFFGAADKVIDILKGPLSDDFRSALAKISLGYDKKTALTEMVRKSRVEQLGFFVRTINMALDAGVGMADTLKRLAAQMRNERAAAAEKKAQEAPIKMLIPLVLFIFPTIFIVIFGPIAINFIQTGGF